jgi:hypothetical protein
MQAQKLCVKLFLKDPAQLHGVKLVPVFQSWIQMHAVADHLAIDVADYEHVPDGPGTVLVTHEANFSMDSAGGRPGLLYQRKQAMPGDLGARLSAVLRYVLEAAIRLEDHPGLAFRTDEILFRIADRLLAPNTAATFEAVKPELEAFLRGLVGADGFTLEYHASPATLFEVTIRLKRVLTPGELLGRLPAAQAAVAS